MFAKTKNGRTLLGFVATDAFENRGAIAYDVGENMYLGVVPIYPFSVVPNFFSLLNRHDLHPLVQENRARNAEYGTACGASIQSIRDSSLGKNQYGAHFYPFHSWRLNAGIAGPTMEFYFGESPWWPEFSTACMAACDSATSRPVRFSYTPSNKKGIAVAAAHNLERRGILDSGSQRKSCEDTKKVIAAQKQRATTPSNKWVMGVEKTMARCRPLTR